MIFNVPMHITYTRNGLTSLSADNLNLPIELRTVKTQTRRLNRGIYKVGKNYAVQRKRGAKAEPDIRIVMDRIWEEKTKEIIIAENGEKYPNEIVISEKDAQSEGGYSPAEYEALFMNLDPKWGGWSRWVFEFHVIEVQK